MLWSRFLADCLSPYNSSFQWSFLSINSYLISRSFSLCRIWSFGASEFAGIVCEKDGIILTILIIRVPCILRSPITFTLKKRSTIWIMISCIEIQSFIIDCSHWLSPVKWHVSRWISIFYQTSSKELWPKVPFIKRVREVFELRTEVPFRLKLTHFGIMHFISFEFPV